MNNVEYEYLKNKYNSFKKSRDEFESNKKEIEELEENEAVKRYKELNSRNNFLFINYGSTLNNEYEFIDSILGNHPIKFDINIYVEVTRDKNNSDSKTYRMLERARNSIGNEVRILNKNIASFEKNNIVIYPPNIVDKDDFFKDLQCKYFEIAFEEGKDKAYKYILQNKNN